MNQKVSQTNARIGEVLINLNKIKSLAIEAPFSLTVNESILTFVNNSKLVIIASTSQPLRCQSTTCTPLLLNSPLHNRPL